MPNSDNDASVARLIGALESSARSSEQVAGQVKGLEREFSSLRSDQAREFLSVRDSFGLRLQDLEDEMRSTNSHLDNLVREAVLTNQLLREYVEERKKEAEHQLGREKEEREWRRQLDLRKLERKEGLEDDTRNMIKRGADEFWSVVKQPLAYLIAGVIFWLLITYFAGPSPQSPMPLPG